MLRLLSSIFLCLWLFGTSSAQQVQPVEYTESIRQFGGLNTIASDFTIPKNECRRAHEISWDRYLGAITKRWGYDSVGVLTGLDSIVAIYPAYYSDGTEQMIYVVDSANTGYGYVYAQVIDEAIDSTTRIWDKFPINSIPYFSKHNDNIYITSADGRGIIWNRDVAREFPLRAPGELLVVPTTDTAYDNYGLARGEYRYMATFNYRSGTNLGSSILRSYIAQPIYTQTKGKNRISGFARPQGDSTYVMDATNDSIDLFVLRTRANPGGLDEGDSVWWGSGALDTTLDYDDTAAFINLVYIDSLPDSLLTTPYGIGDNPWWGRDSTSVDSNDIRHYYGAPSYLSTDSFITYDTAGDTASSYGIFYGIPGQHDTLGYAYMCTFIDTITGLESDSGRTLYVFTDSTKRDGDEYPFNFNIGLPRISAGNSGLVINLYRGMIYQITYDTGALVEVFEYDNPEIQFFVDQGIVELWAQYFAVDTIIVTDYFLLGQYLNTDSVVVDSIRFDSLKVKRRYQRYSPPTQLKSTFTYDDKLFGIQKSNLRFSLLDSAYAWGTFDFASLNQSDGDEGVIAFPMQGGILFLKNKSAYNVYQDSDGNWGETEITGLPGCIASHSYAKGMGGHYYLSDYGVVRINDGKQLDRRYDQLLVSSMLSNFDKLPITDKRRAIGTYLPMSREYLLTIGDTTYAYSERANAWSTWSLPFASTGLYGIESAAGFVPGDTLYFTRPGDSLIYRYGTSEIDNHDTITVIWESAPIFVDNWYEQIQALGVWAYGDTSDVGLAIRRIDENSDYLTTPAKAFLMPNLGVRYEEKSMTRKTALYQSLEMTIITSDSSRVDGINIFYVRTNKYPRK